MELSVIIPTYNEENFIAETVTQVLEKSKNFVDEVIVVDGGSTDETVGRAQEAGAVVVRSSRKGRAAQMNVGAEQAGGDILYFLHADSHPPERFASSIHQAVTDVAAGCFRLSFDDDHWLLNFYTWFTRFDIDLFRFGDQSLFMKREVFFELRGFREDHIVMEDQEIVRRIKDQYSFTVLSDSVTTSARKYRRVGIIRLQLIFTLILTLYYLGFSQHRLVSIYKGLIQ